MADPRIKVNRRATAQMVKISQERIDKIVQDISEGAPQKHAAEANGIAYATLYYWIKQGEFDLFHDVDSREANLVKSLRAIEMKKIKEFTQNISEEKKGHQGCQWLLERNFWKYFSAHAPVAQLAHQMELDQIADAEKELEEKELEAEADKTS